MEPDAAPELWNRTSRAAQEALTLKQISCKQTASTFTITTNAVQ
jgi:hypothetical protein